jgi:c-di-GMP-binding flagellar brake protein YcgR
MGQNISTVNFERRRHPRFSVNLPAEYRKIDNPKAHPANTADLSEGGLLLYVSETMEIGQELSLKVFFSSGRDLTTVKTQVRVVWKDTRIENEGLYRIGVKIVDIPTEDLLLLRTFLNNLMALKVSQELIAATGKFSTY